MIPPIDERLPTPDGDADYDTYQYLAFAFPPNADLLLYWIGVMTILEYSSSWTQEGTLTPYDVSRIFARVANSRMKLNMLLGLVVPTIADPLPDGLLLADGGTYDIADYPELAEVLPDSSKTASQFTLPDLRGRFLLPASPTYTEGTIGGEETHTLSIAELPSHSHASDYPSQGIDLEAPGAPDITAVGNPPTRIGTTSNVGGDQPHNNMPPFYALRYAVIARLT